MKLDIFIRLYDREGKVRQFSMEYFRCSVGAVYYYQSQTSFNELSL